MKLSCIFTIIQLNHSIVQDIEHFISEGNSFMVYIYIYIYYICYMLSWKQCAPRLPGYHHNGFVATHALGHMMYGYKLLVPMNQRVLSKLSKEYNISGHKWSTTHRVLKSYKSKMSIITYMFSRYMFSLSCFCEIWAL